MITLSLNFDKVFGPDDRASHTKKVRDLVDSHLAFPGSDKLKMGLTIRDNGSSSVSFAGPRDLVSEARRIWHENVKPVVNQMQSRAVKTAASLKKKATASVNKAKKSVAPKAKKVRAAVKKSARVAPKKKAPSKKKK